MLSTISLVVASLSTGNKIGLAAVGLAFVVFALVSSFVLPRRNPDFPGNRLGSYAALCALFFVAMIAAVLDFDREPKEKAAETTAAATTSATTTTAATTTSPRRPPPPQRRPGRRPRVMQRPARRCSPRRAAAAATR